MRVVDPDHRVHVYIAGPINNGGLITDPATIRANIVAAIRTADHLFTLGFIPFVPHLNYYWHDLYPRTNHDWLMWDFAWLRKCNVLFRLPGESQGSDREVEFARQIETKMGRGIPVIHTEEDLISWYEEHKENLNFHAPSAT